MSLQNGIGRLVSQSNQGNFQCYQSYHRTGGASVLGEYRSDYATPRAVTIQYIGSGLDVPDTDSQRGSKQEHSDATRCRRGR